ncbi:hypothetical protein [Aquisediminimonas profunda]|uniref:hypothetical protein n=1 Tax=Aquisediminimonas profunda TaxID=1550733 RepID=UPI001C62D9FB|nr:hypothetical protein [Aquisediminimonas profunda]
MIAWLGFPEMAKGTPTQAVAQASARILRPVIIRTGKGAESQVLRPLKPKERKCIEPDASNLPGCRLIVTDIE